MSKKENVRWTLTRIGLMLAYLDQNVSQRLKLFSDSKQDAAEQNHPRVVSSKSKKSIHRDIAAHVFKEDPKYKDEFQRRPSRFTRSVESKLAMLVPSFIFPRTYK